MALLVIKRRKEYSYKLGDFKVFVDNKLVLRTLEAPAVQIEVSPGTHSIQAVLGPVVKSPVVNFTILAQETKEFTVGASTQKMVSIPKWFWLAELVIILLLLIASSVFSLPYLVVIIVPAVILLLYVLLLSRSTYITVDETSFPV